MQELTEKNNSIVEDEKDIKIGLMQNINGIFIIGRALKRIQEGKKYKTELGYNTFEEYIEQRIGFSKKTGYRYIEITSKLSENVSALTQNLTISKLYLIASAVENEQQALDIIQEKHIVNNEEKTIENMTTRELEQVVKEKKELAKQIKEEQEYSDELQQAIKDKEQQINKLKTEIETMQIPEKEIIEKEVVREVIPENLIKEKQHLEEELEQLRKRAEKAEDTIRSIRLETKIEEDNVFDTAKLDALLLNVKDFLAKNSKFTYLKEELQNIPPKKKRFVEQSVNSIKEWAMLMEQALDNRQDMVGNIIYGEGEIIDE